jgi:hypothetical protein
MSVILTDEEFILLYQATWMSIHPFDIPMSLEKSDEAIAVLDALPDCALLRVAALEEIRNQSPS